MAFASPPDAALPREEACGHCATRSGASSTVASEPGARPLSVLGHATTVLLDQVTIRVDASQVYGGNRQSESFTLTEHKAYDFVAAHQSTLQKITEFVPVRLIPF